MWFLFVPYSIEMSFFPPFGYEARADHPAADEHMRAKTH